MRLRGEEGASAVEFAIIAPLLFMLLFGILGFGLAFLQVQSIRTAVREGGRAAAVGATVKGVRDKTVAASSGSIPSGQASLVEVSPSSGGVNLPACTPQQIGDDVTVTYRTTNLPQGGVVVHIPLLPDIVMRPTISASFRCEV
jgi:Flp pilus assembly protein TadG